MFNPDALGVGAERKKNNQKNMHLKSGTLLQGGKYRIEKVLGQGGFGITYLAVQTVLNRKVAVKEFFMKEHCNRDESSSCVSVPSLGSKELVEKFRAKFIKEAQTISGFDNHHIIRIIDVFEENGTAYYVMDYLSGGSLSDHIPSVGLPESEALRYIRQVADALSYIHAKNILHLDVKPSNVLFRENGEAVLIDFGISKHYDEAGGSQTSSTPVGVSEGYAPTEQYENEGVASFSASTDVYALGATLYCLLCGSRPPKASIVLNDGLPPLPSSVSRPVRAAVEKAMSPRRKDRPQSVVEFMSLLEQPEVHDEGDVTVVIGADKEDVVESGDVQVDPVLNDDKGNFKKWLWPLLAGLAAVLVLFLVFRERLLPQDEDIVVEESVASYKDGILRVKGVEYPMVYVSGGCFDMGATSEQGSDADSDEQPVHRVTLSSYRIGKYEVTQELWEAVMGSNPSHFKGSRHPVEQVKWNDCQRFINKLNELTGQNFRLPTEAEWEFAARGGNSSRGYKYSGSNNVDNVAWYSGNSGYTTHNVGTKSPNELGVYDMSGNVCEWCSDWYGEYSSASQTNPKGPGSGSNRVDRGGSWSNIARNSRVSIRYYSTPDNRYANLGFRLCL